MPNGGDHVNDNQIPGQRIIAWLRDTWAEIDYARRRMIELNMATPMLLLPPGRASIDELEALYAHPSREPNDEFP